MTQELAKKTISYCCNNPNNFENYLQDQYAKHNGGKSFWNQLLKEAETHGYHSGLPNGFKDNLKHYCATKLEEISNDEELKSQIKKRDEKILELQESNLRLQNEYFPYAIKQASVWKRYYWIGIISTGVGTLLGASLGLIPSKNQEQNQVQDVILIHDTVYSIKHDTVYLEKKSSKDSLPPVKKK